MSGASLFSGDEIKNGRYGESGRKVYDNAKDIEEIQSVIKGSPGRVVDNLVLSQSPSAVRTALIVGPIIYGPGRGPGNTRTMQGPECAKYTLKSGHGFRLGGGKSVWSYIHVADVGSLVCLLVDAASKGTEGLWNDEGIYLPENGQIVSCRSEIESCANHHSSRLETSLHSLQKRHIDRAISKTPMQTQSLTPRTLIKSCRTPQFCLVPMPNWQSQRPEKISSGSRRKEVSKMMFQALSGAKLRVWVSNQQHELRISEGTTRR